MCLLPGFEAPVPVDSKAWGLVYAIRVFIFALFVSVGCFFAAFHWIEGVGNLLIALLSLFTFFYRTEYGLYPLSIMCTAITFVMLDIWAIVRVLMTYASPYRASPSDAKRINSWQHDVYLAAIFLDLIIFTVIVVLCMWLFGHVRRLSLAARGPDSAVDDDEDDLFGIMPPPGARRGPRPGAAGGYQQVDGGDGQSYLQPNVGGARGLHGGNSSAAAGDGAGGASAGGPGGQGGAANGGGGRYNFTSSQGYRLED